MPSKKSKKNTPAAVTQDISATDGDSEDLLDDLLAQLDARGNQQEIAAQPMMHDSESAIQRKQDAKARFKARQARKAAHLTDSYVGHDAQAAADLERLTLEENEDIAKLCRELSLQIYQIDPDGHCLFSAIADQLVLAGLLQPQEARYSHLRAKASDYIRSHRDDFLPFLPSPDPPVDVKESGLMTPQQFDNYCTLMQNTAVWGGEPEIVALSRAFNVRIQVVQSGKPPIVVHEPPDLSAESHVLYISYHKRLYGLGEHYNSLRPIPRSGP